MKKHLKILLLFIAILAIFAGCTSNSSNNGSNYDSNYEHYDENQSNNSVAEVTPFSQYSVTDSGYCGYPNSSDVIWNYYAEINAIEFIGTGSIKDYSTFDEMRDIPWYYYRESIQQVYISEGITRIGNYVFEKFNCITEFEIPNGVTSIGRYAFWACENLETVYLPNSITEVEGKAFGYCENLKSIYFLGIEDEWSLINFAEDAAMGTSPELEVYMY